MFWSITCISIVFISAITLLIVRLKRQISNKKYLQKQKDFQTYGQNYRSIAFFHPYCNSAGGGEKVLWCMILGLLKNADFKENYRIIIYSGDYLPKQQILQRAQDRFNIQLLEYQNIIEIVDVPKRSLLEPKNTFTMIFQILGTIYFTYKCLQVYVPDVFLDSTGFPFGYIVVSWLSPQTKIAAYVHYPFISQDMIQQVTSSQKRYNNNQRIADSRYLTFAKLVYYKMLLLLYKFMGRYVDFAYANSSWTAGHMKEIWGKNIKIELLFPPCSVENFLRRKQFTDKPIIVSFAQYRPEKQHSKQIKILRSLIKRLPKEISDQVRLIIVGSCRGPQDEELLAQLKKEVDKLNLNKYISFKVNLTYPEIVETLCSGMIGIHTMEYEHFGIALVEMMAAGLITIAHNSAGPQMDIIQFSEEYGFLCQTDEDYTNAIIQVLQMTTEERQTIISNSRKRAITFSEENFMENFNDSFQKFLGCF